MHGLKGGGWKRKRPGHGHHGWDDLAGNRRNADPGTYYRLAPPRLPPTLHRTVVSSQVFTGLDNYMWKLTYKWAKHSHPNKPKRWIVNRYFGQFNQSRQAKWVFGDRDSGAYLRMFAWTRIIRHQLVAGTSSPDDPALTEYWANPRRPGPPPPMDPAAHRLLIAHAGRCPLFRVLPPPRQ